MPPGEQSCEDAQAFAAARNPRADSSDRNVCDRRGFVVSHPFQSNEEDCRPLLLRQFGEGALQIAKLQTRNLIRRERRPRAILLQFDTGSLARCPAEETDMAIVQDGEQPGPKIGSFFPQVNLPEGMSKAILDELVSGADITRQGARVTRKTGYQGFDFPVKASVDRSPFWPAKLRTGMTAAVLRFCK
jgi:hypothetical protein